MHVISNAKLDFLVFWLSAFFCWLKPGGSITKNGKLNGPCMFCLSGFFHLDGIGENPCAEHHELNSKLMFLLAAFRRQLDWNSDTF